MSLPWWPFGQQVTVLRAAEPHGTDEYGLPVRGPDIERELTGCALAPGPGSETANAIEDQTTDRLTLYVPCAADVRADDRLRIDGRIWHVNGPPYRLRSPLTGHLGPLVVTATAHTG